MLKVDSREDKMVLTLLEKERIDYEVVLLPVGDFVFEKKGICIERKTISDFVNSMRGGHLQKQLLQMDQFPHKFLLISGELKEYAMSDTKWTVEHHVGALVSCSVRYGVKVLTFNNDMQLIKAVGKICDKVEDGKSVSIYQTEVFRAKHDDLKMSLLMCFPGIGEKRAKKMLIENPAIKRRATELIKVVTDNGNDTTED